MRAMATLTGNQLPNEAFVSLDGDVAAGTYFAQLAQLNAAHGTDLGFLGHPASVAEADARMQQLVTRASHHGQPGRLSRLPPTGGTGRRART